MSTILWFQAWLINIVCIRLEFGQCRPWVSGKTQAAMCRSPAIQFLGVVNGCIRQQRRMGFAKREAAGKGNQAKYPVGGYRVWH